MSFAFQRMVRVSVLDVLRLTIPCSKNEPSQAPLSGDWKATRFILKARLKDPVPKRSRFDWPLLTTRHRIASSMTMSLSGSFVQSFQIVH